MSPVRAALTMAADRFADPTFERLRSPTADIDALSAVLADSTVGGFDVQTVINQPSGVVEQELERFFSNRKPDDLLLVYFSCHGVKDPAGRLYFATTDTQFELLRSTGISAAFVSEQMEYSRSRRIVLLLDCCYSGAFLKGFRSRGDATVTVDQLEGRGRAVITASRATEYAFEADDVTAEDVRPSVFTHAIVEGLTSGQADLNGDGLVTVDELYDFVYEEVRGQVAGQTPGRWADVEGNLVVARNPNPPVQDDALLAEMRRAVGTDLPGQRLGTVAQLRSPEADPIPTTLPDVSVASARSSVVDGPARLAAAIAVIAALTIVAAGQVQYLIGARDDRRLGLRAWYSYGSWLLLVLVALAASSIIRRTRAAETGLAILAVLSPLALVQLLMGIGDNYNWSKQHSGTGLGWKLAEGGFALLVWAGAVAATRLVRTPVLRTLPFGQTTGMGRFGPLLPVAAVAIGFALTLGWLRLWFGWIGFVGRSSPPASPILPLAIGLALLSAFVFGSWPRRHTRPVQAVILVVVAAVVVVLVAGTAGLERQEVWYGLAFAMLAVENAAIPLLATLARLPGSGAAGVLAAWLVASTLLLRSDRSDSEALSSEPLIGALIAGGLLVFALWRWNRNSSPLTASHSPALVMRRTRGASLAMAGALGLMLVASIQNRLEKYEFPGYRRDRTRVEAVAERFPYATVADAWTKADLGDTTALQEIQAQVPFKYRNGRQEGDTIIFTFEGTYGECIDLASQPGGNTVRTRAGDCLPVYVEPAVPTTTP